MRKGKMTPSNPLTHKLTEEKPGKARITLKKDQNHLISQEHYLLHIQVDLTL